MPSIARRRSLSCDLSSWKAWLKVARKNQTNVHDVGRGQMTSETGVAVHVKSSREQQRAERGARRLQEFQEGKRAEHCTAHWLPFWLSSGGSTIEVAAKKGAMCGLNGCAINRWPPVARANPRRLFSRISRFPGLRGSNGGRSHCSRWLAAAFGGFLGPVDSLEVRTLGGEREMPKES